MARRTTIDLTTYSELDAWAISLQEMFRSLKRAGFDEECALAIIIEPTAYPEWILPSLPNQIDPIEWDDEED